VLAAAFANPGMEEFVVIAKGEASTAMGELASGEFFSTLGVKALIGRTFTPEDDQAGSPPVAVVSYGFWLSRLGADREVVGKSITVSGVPFTVVGVAAPEFRGMQPGFSSDLWLPLSAERVLNPANRVFDGGFWRLQIVGRLKPGVSPEQARAALEVNFLQTANSAPTLGFKPQDQPHLMLDSASRGFGTLRQIFSKPLLVLLTLTALVLLIACANFANLMFARAISRQREIAMRRTLGAGRGRLIRQLLTESVLLAAAGGVAGLFLAWQGSKALASAVHNWWALLSLDVSPNWRVLAFTVTVSIAVGILSGLAPAWHGTAMDLAPTLKAATGPSSLGGVSGRRSLLRDGLVVCQITLATLVLVAAGLFLRTLVKLKSVELGFNPRNLILFEISPEQSAYKSEAVKRLYQQMTDRVSALPDVASASFSRFALVGTNLNSDEVWIRGGAHPAAAQVDTLPVGPRFFETMEIPLLEGRGITAQDIQGSKRVAVINAAMAQRYFAAQNPLGRWLGAGQDGKNTSEIIGVVGDAKYNEVSRDVAPTVYTPLLGGRATFALRTAIDPRTLIPAVRRVVRELDPDLPIISIQTQAEQIEKTLFEQRLIADLSGLFGLLALMLACVGVYGVVSYGVAVRTNEIGIRMALGASPSHILGLVLRQSAVLTLSGVGLGMAGAVALTRVAKALLYGVTPTDTAAFAGALVIMPVVAMIASYVPARRATKVDPMTALRQE
jgi:predicted permease